MPILEDNTMFSDNCSPVLCIDHRLVNKKNKNIISYINILITNHEHSNQRTQTTNPNSNPTPPPPPILNIPSQLCMGGILFPLFVCQHCLVAIPNVDITPSYNLNHPPSNTCNRIIYENKETKIRKRK